MATITIGRKLSYLTDSVTAVQGQGGVAAWRVLDKARLVSVEYDYIELTYHVSKPTLVVSVVYRSGGSSGTIVATVLISYDDADNIKTVTRS